MILNIVIILISIIGLSITYHCRKINKVHNKQNMAQIGTMLMIAWICSIVFNIVILFEVN